MKGKLMIGKYAAVGAIAMLLVPLTACRESQNASQTAQVGSATDVSNPVQQEEKIRLEGLRFKADGSTLRPNSKPILDAAAEILKGKPDRQKIYVNAYTDPTGGKEENLKLSQRRAENVKAYLETQGIESERMIPRGFGAENFVASNDTAKTRKQNRRVELVPVAN